jgi:hypothetical protein
MQRLQGFIQAITSSDFQNVFGFLKTRTAKMLAGKQLQQGILLHPAAF